MSPKRLTPLLLGLCLVACSTREALPSREAATFFGIEEEAPLTRSLLTASRVETKKTGITLAAYRGGVLAEAAHFTSSLGAMPLRLEAGKTYTVYALVNMGNQVQALPAAESDLSTFTYTLPGYTTAGSGINARGMPMAGSLSCTAGSGSTAIPVQRLLAKVNVDIEVCIPGASISDVKVYNLNRSLRPFGTSRVAATGDLLGAQEVSTGAGSGENKATSTSGATGHFVLYVPENLQGDIGGIGSSREKNPDLNATVDARLSRLSYLEVRVPVSGLYSGSVTYRSCLGNNATSNFDIERNREYSWQLRYLEDGLQYNDWKCVTGALTDGRYLSFTEDPIAAEAGEEISWDDVLSTNLPLSGIGFTFGQSGFASFTGSGFRLADSPSSPSSPLTARALSNPRSSLTALTHVRAVNKSVAWRGGEAEVREGETVRAFTAYPGDNVEAGVDYGYSWEGAFIALPGRSGAEWTWTEAPGNGITSAAGVSGGKDIVTYTVGASVAPGYYPIRVQRTAKSQGDDAFLHVHPETEVSYRYFISSQANAAATPLTEAVVSSASYSYTYLYLIEHQVTKFRGTVTEDVFSRVVPFSEASWNFDPSVSQNIGYYASAGAIPRMDYDDLLVLSGNNSWARLRPAIQDSNVPRKRHHGWSRLLISPSAHPDIQCSIDLRVDGYGYRYDLQPATATLIAEGGTLQLQLLQKKDFYEGNTLKTPDTGDGTDITSVAYYARWSSNAPYCVQVNQSYPFGLCTGVYAGTATVTCQYNPSYGPLNGDYQADFTLQSVISVEYGQEEVTYALLLSPENGRLKVGNTARLTATLIRYVNGEESYRTTTPDGITWSSANAAIASVDGSGLVTGISAGGPVTITASWTDGTANATATAAVVVIPPSGIGIDNGWETGDDINL